jgi:glucuronoarabinoxylan endo-1,4-beta-xylanase
MEKIWRKMAMMAMLCVGMSSVATAQTKATVRLDAQAKHQHITGFGGFVCSPQFTYNHMSNAEIEKVWGKNSTVGCNIMRLYIPIGKSAWGQSLATAKKAKQMGLIVFASPWGQPSEWKTNGTSNAKNSDGTTGKLKRANWADYAKYLEEYVQYLRKNGVELDAISIQNEPDWAATYAGCLWDASEIAEFVKTYGRTISCKIMAPETLAVSDSYANALNKSDVIDCFDIYGGHQYGGIQSAYKNLAKKGKEIWMTEYLINWNEIENNTRNYDFSKDFFNFFTAINTCMLGDFNAWIHYAAKRYYAMMGDGQRGTSNGSITKRGYIMAHFARFVTGMTRIDATWSGNSLESSAYLSVTGDTVVAVMSNSGDEEVTLTVDLPFYTQQGELYTTGKSKSFSKTVLTQETETCRPVTTIAAKSVCTVLFVRSRDRQASNMTGSTTRFDRIDDLKTTKTSFGTAYQLSGKGKTFDSSNPLISSRTTASYGYVDLGNRFSQLVMHIKKVSSTNSYTMGAPTLVYVNKAGKVQKHEYERIDLSRRENFDIILDLSPATLTDGCIGLISFTCDNAVSKLTITFGDVYLANSEQYAAKLTGAYVADDSNVLEFTADEACTSLDLTGVTDFPAELPWLEGTNRVAYVAESSALAADNVVKGAVCQNLKLSADGGDFRPATAFTANQASMTVNIEGARLLMLPFAANVPAGVKVYTLADDLTLQEVTEISAHQPVLVEATGAITFTGSGDVSYAASPMTNLLRGTYVQIPLYTGDYVLGQKEGQWGLVRQTATSTLAPFDVYAQVDSSDSFIPLGLTATGIVDLTSETLPDAVYYDVQGRRLKNLEDVQKGQIILIRKGGQVIKMIK